MKLPFAAVVPVFNPEPGLIELVDELKSRFSVVVVVDDGSVEEREAFAALPSEVNVLRHAQNRGKGCAMKTALRWLSEKHPTICGVVFADGDGQHRMGDVVAVAEKARVENRVVFGVRDFSRPGIPFRSWWGNRWTAIEVGLLFGLWLKDTQTGLRAVPRRLFSALIDLRGDRFEYEAGWFALLRRLKETIVEVPIDTIYRRGNRVSHFRPWADTILTQRALFSK